MRTDYSVERATPVTGFSSELGERGHALLIRCEKSGEAKALGDWLPTDMTIEGREQFAAIVVTSEKISDAAIDRVSGASGVISFDQTQGMFHRVAHDPHVCSVAICERRVTEMYPERYVASSHANAAWNEPSVPD